MATTNVIDKKIVLKYSEGSFSFDKIDVNANKDKLYGLAGILNSFQSQKPPVKITSVVTTQIA